jgi:predicted nucleic-acid-binding protein
MIGLDTNILVRYLTQDDPVQFARASQVIERRCAESRPGFVSLVTIAETVWVLDSVYGIPARRIADAVERILQAATLIVQNEQEVFTAMIALRAGRADFADALIAALGSWAGCSATLTFDRKALRMAGFELA